MKLIIQTAASGLMAFIITSILVAPLKSIALKLDLVDKPNARKIHTEPVPLIGGISIAISVFLSLLINPKAIEALYPLLGVIFSSVIMLIVGIVDDRFDLKAKHKLIIQLLCAFGIAASGLRITSLCGIFGIYHISVILQYSFTIIVIVGVVNAINLMDGINGLAAEIAIIGFSMLSILAYITNHLFLAIVFITFIGALIAFFRFNNRSKIFMGDAGSLFLGTVLVGACMYFIQPSVSGLYYNSMITISVIGFFAIPVLDSLRVYLARLKKGVSPFAADKTHLHHLFLLIGMNHKQASFSISVLFIIVMITGIILYNSISINLTIMFILLIFSSLSLMLNLNKKLKEWHLKLKEMEA